MPRVFFHVAPRYTAGSPALVDEVTARQVAAEEQRAYERYLTGAYGVEERTTAETKGVERIAYATEDKGNVRYITDLISGRRFRMNMRKTTAWYRWSEGTVEPGIEVEMEPGIFRPIEFVKDAEGWRHSEMMVSV